MNSFSILLIRKNCRNSQVLSVDLQQSISFKGLCWCLETSIYLLSCFHLSVNYWSNQDPLKKNHSLLQSRHKGEHRTWRLLVVSGLSLTHLAALVSSRLYQNFNFLDSSSQQDRKLIMYRGLLGVHVDGSGWSWITISCHLAIFMEYICIHWKYCCVAKRVL